MGIENIWTNYIRNYVEEKNLLTFYDRFLQRFEERWDDFVAKYDYENLCQINNGNRLRPMLVYWAYLLNQPESQLFDIDDNQLDFIIDFCIVVEAIHKMSLLVDDWIDGDVARHGAPTFHAIYGADTAVLLAMNLLLKGILDLSNNLTNINEETYRKSITLALQIASDMTLGALDEVSFTGRMIEIAKVKEIVDLETSSIIRNGIIMGYTAGSGSDSEIISLLDDIGYCCGYAFQSLNDLEPFGNASALVKHKGALSTDILKNRKNIVVAYIYTWAKSDEIEHLESINDPNQMFNCVVSLLKKYEIKATMLEEIDNLQMRINDRISQIETLSARSKWCSFFKDFVHITISASKERALGK